MKIVKLQILVIVLFFIVILGINCKKNTNPPEENCSPFSGITQIDREGNIISTDANDWQDSGILKSIIAYPNPAGTFCSIQYSLYDSVFLKVTVNDKPEHIVRTLVDDTLNAGIYIVMWDLKNNSGEELPNCIYRVYFNAFTANGDTLRTYGDIQIQR